VLLVSGGAKLLAARRRSIGPARGGIPVVVLAVVELASAASVLALDAAWPVWLALAMLAVFTGVVLAYLLRGVVAPCNCFGSLDTKPVSSWTLVRNTWFVALAVVATGAPHSVGPLSPTAVALFVVSLVLIVAT